MSHGGNYNRGWRGSPSLTDSLLQGGWGIIPARWKKLLDSSLLGQGVGLPTPCSPITSPDPPPFLHLLHLPSGHGLPKAPIAIPHIQNSKALLFVATKITHSRVSSPSLRVLYSWIISAPPQTLAPLLLLLSSSSLHSLSC